MDGLSNFFEFIFKILKWIIMLVFIGFVVVFFRSCSDVAELTTSGTSASCETLNQLAIKSESENKRFNELDMKKEAWKELEKAEYYYKKIIIECPNEYFYKSAQTKRDLILKKLNQ